jgi:hypothetical protein
LVSEEESMGFGLLEECRELDFEEPGELGFESTELLGAVGHKMSRVKKWRSGFILLISIDAFLVDGIEGSVDRFQGIGDAFDGFE